MEVALFFIAAVTSLAGALGVVVAKTPLRSALSLLGSLVGVSFSFFLLKSPFLGAAHLLMAGGGVLVLLLFVFMTVDPNRLPRIFRGGIGIIRTGGLVAAGVILYQVLGAIEATSSLPLDGSLAAVGDSLLVSQVFLFVGIGLLLLVAIVAAVVMTRRSA